MGNSEVWGPIGNRLMIVGLTGGIAAGKTEVAREFARLGAPVIDADRVAREVVLPGNTAYDKLVREFGNSILEDSGQVDRAALADLIFVDEEKRRLVNSITHPVILTEIVEQVARCANSLGPDEAPTVIVDAALIVDIGASRVFDELIVVTADEEIRMRRLISDRGMSEVESRKRIASQVRDSQRIDMADLVIENNGTLEQLKITVDDVWREIERRSRSLYS